MMNFEYVLSIFDKLLLKEVENFGGFVNFHAHLDRVSTLSPKYFQSMGIDPITGAAILSLSAKQNVVGELHKTYKHEDLKKRMRESLESQYKMMTRTVYTMVDCTPDLDENGLIALNVANELKEEFQDKLTLYVGIHPIFGFHPKNDHSRWQIYKKAAEQADFLGGLPQRDKRSGSIGFKEHLRRILLLGQELYKPVHIHCDQANSVIEEDTELLIQAVEWVGAPKIDAYTIINEPTVYAIHSISPSTYSEKRFNRMLDGLLKNNIGIIVCSSAALSMHQIRTLNSPTHNSIARVLEMAERGVNIKLGTDNITDIFVCSSDGSMLTEVKILSHAIRFYVISVLAKLSTGRQLNQMDKKIIKDVLYNNKERNMFYV